MVRSVLRLDAEDPNKFIWEIYEMGSTTTPVDSDKFRLSGSGQDEIEWHLRCVPQESGVDLYLQRDYDSSSGRWDADVCYEMREDLLGQHPTIQVTNHYPNKKADDVLSGLEAIKFSYGKQNSFFLFFVFRAVKIDVVNAKKRVREDAPSQTMAKYLSDGQFSDVTIVVDGQELMAHKVVLAAHSPVLEKMFTQDMVEKHTNRVEINDISVDLFKALLQFIYNKQFEAVKESSVELIQVAAKYQMDTLKRECEDELISQLSVDNCLRFLQIGYSVGAKKLVRKSLKFMGQNNKNSDQIFAAVEEFSIQFNSP